MLKDASHNAIWSALKAGNKEALLALYEFFYIDGINYGVRLTGDRSLTSDAITQCLLQLWKKRESLPVITNLRAYLLTCLRHQLYSMLRVEGRRAAHAAAYQRFTAVEEQSYEECLVAAQTNSQLSHRLHDAFQSLTSREKELLELRFFRDLSYDEIAATCGITKRTAYNIIHRAVNNLREAITLRPGGASLSGITTPLLILFFFFSW